jgi:hypothetical protein
MSTTNDLDLLRLAAKAAGIEINDARQAEREACGFGGAGLWTNTTTHWNPLKDDGDALRLAVKLDMQVWRGKGPTVCGMPPSGDFWKRLNEPLGDDPYAATRRAIVRAAAEIGKAMP